MAEKLTREATFPEEMEELVSSISQIRIQNLRSDLFQQQNIASPYTLVMERFCAEKKTGDVEILDGKSVFPLTLTRQQYQYLIDRPLHSHNYLEIMIVLSGAVLNRFGEESYTCSAGQGYIMNTNIRHKEEPIGDAEILFVGMKREFLLDLLSIMQTENTTLPNPALNDFFSLCGRFHRYLQKSTLGLFTDDKRTEHSSGFRPIIQVRCGCCEKESAR